MSQPPKPSAIFTLPHVQRNWHRLTNGPNKSCKKGFFFFVLLCVHEEDLNACIKDIINA